jgi:hypothetical protein
MTKLLKYNDLIYLFKYKQKLNRINIEYNQNKSKKKNTNSLKKEYLFNVRNILLL